MTMIPAILVHGGAGPRLAEDSEEAAKRGCLTAARAGYSVLDRGGSSLDAVEVACRALEDDVTFNAGTGAALNSIGEVELDASIMEGTSLSAGAVAVVRTVRNPISAARVVMERSGHVLMVGVGAEAFLHAQGIVLVDPASLVTEAARRRWVAREARGHGTVGAVAVDSRRRLAAGTSTGGMSGKRPGRVGDSPLIGCGTYADDRLGAVSATGAGELIIRTTLARQALEGLRRGMTPHEAAIRSLEDITRLGGEAGLIMVTPEGALGCAFSGERMARAWAGGVGRFGVAFGPDDVFN